MKLSKNYIPLDTSRPVWESFFTVAPLIVVGTKEGEHYDLAPKHMATPLGHENFFGFVCTPDHGTYHNVEREGVFTISFPKPEELVLASLAASPRCGEAEGNKRIVHELPTFPAPHIDAPLLQGAYLYFECEHTRTIDGFGRHSLICGRITGAYVDEEYLRVSEQDEQSMINDAPLLAYLPYGRFAEISKTRQFPFPKDFKL